MFDEGPIYDFMTMMEALVVLNFDYQEFYTSEDFETIKILSSIESLLEEVPENFLQKKHDKRN